MKNGAEISCLENVCWIVTIQNQEKKFEEGTTEYLVELKR